MIGKVHAMMAAMIQCVKLPSELPCERTEFGNISEIKTQITAPCDKAKNAIKPDQVYNHKMIGGTRAIEMQMP